MGKFARRVLDAAGSDRWERLNQNFAAIQNILDVIQRKLPDIGLDTGNLRISGNLGIGNIVTATGPVGNVVGKAQVFDNKGNSKGYIVIYDGVT